MMNAIATLGLIVLFVWIMFFLDWLARRKDRRKREGRT